jgi:hypothetical protein
MRQKTFLFRIPGQDGMYDFSEVQKMRLNKNTILSGTEVIGQNRSRYIGKMRLSSVLSKFG